MDTTTKASPLDYATALPVSHGAQLAWLYALQFYGRHGRFPNAADIAAKLNVGDRQARRIVSELIGVGEFQRDQPGVVYMAAAV